MSLFKKEKNKKKDFSVDDTENKRDEDLCFLIAKGIGRIIFSQGVFVIIIIALTAFICSKVKEKNYVQPVQDESTSGAISEVKE